MDSREYASLVVSQTGNSRKFHVTKGVFSFELRAEEAGVKAVPGEEVVVPSLFDDLAVADDEDQIGVGWWKGGGR